MDIDTLKERLGGEWYDTWWCTIFEWINHSEYPFDFWKEVNYGWLEMYSPKEERRCTSMAQRNPISREEFFDRYVNSNPYYNEKYYL